MKKLILIFALCLVGIYCGLLGERTTVSDAQRAQGFSCQSASSLGLMRAGEERFNYIPNLCVKAICGSDGTITQMTCGTARGPPECKLVSDMSKPYPECCPKIYCNNV